MSTVILVANNAPPVRGGSAAVYDAVARHAGGQVLLVAARRSYVTGLPQIGWREHDRHAPYKVVRLDLLRTELGTPPGGVQRGLFLLRDAWIRLRLLAVVLALAVRHRAACVCVGELLASAWLLAALRFVPGLRTAAYVHGEEITTAEPYDPAHRRTRRALRAADAVVVVSRFTRQAVLAMLPAGAADRVSLVENGVEAVRFPALGRPADLVERYGLQGCFVFVSVCRLLEKKGVDNAIRAFAAAFSGQDTVRMLVVGEGPFAPVLERLAVEQGVASRVVFTGPVPGEELAAHYRAGDVFVMPNRRLENGDTEGFGLVFLEANSSGLPVIAGQDGGSTAAVTDGVNGLVVDGADVAAVAAAMTRMHADAGLRARLAEGGREVAAQAGWGQRTAAFLAACRGPARPHAGAAVREAA